MASLTGMQKAACVKRLTLSKILLAGGAGGELPIRHSSISIAKNENSSVVLLFSQSMAAR